MTALLLLGNYRPTLTLARTLAAPGRRIVVTRGGGEGFSEYSRFVSGVWDEPDPAEDEGRFIAALAAYLEAHADIEIVLPVTESYAVALARHADALPRSRIYATPRPEMVVAATDKIGMLDKAASLAVPVAPYRAVGALAELNGAATAIGFPVVVRATDPSLRLGTEKAVTLRSARDLAAAFPVWPDGHRSLLVQCRVGGRRHNLYFAARQGEIVRLAHAVIGATDRSDGSGLATEGMTIEPDPALAAHCAALVAGLDYHGIGCAQFLVAEAAGSVSFLEINPRIAGNHAVPEAAGLALGPLAVALACEPDAEVAYRAGRPGLRYSWTYGALRALKVGLSRGQVPLRAVPRHLARIAWSCLRSDVHMTWSWRDPLPTLALFYQQFAPAFLKIDRPMTAADDKAAAAAVAAVSDEPELSTHASRRYQ